MLEVLRDNNGGILGCCEYYIVDEKANIDDKGLYIWINNCEVSKSAEHKGCLREFVRIIAGLHPWTQYGYFWRKQKYPDRSPRIYSRRIWMNLIKQGE